MSALCFYFQVHQPYRLRHYTFFDIGVDSFYEDEDANCGIMLKVARKCYLPMNALLLKLIRKYDGRFKVSFSISGKAPSDSHLDTVCRETFIRSASPSWVIPDFLRSNCRFVPKAIFLPSLFTRM